ncbi:hypothetical protein [Candidatus Nitrososphaera sp. FF02]|uniref:hypothetical protein n=1 Tax=Candidatus Nitrososphaera sp. FF02 TaxID=3398226 RepID=UPI0039EBC952
MVDRVKAIAGIQRTLKGLLFTETEVFYFHLENLGVKPDEILDKPEQFAKTICDIFGKGSPLVERAIISEVSRELSVDPKGDLVAMLRSISKG